MQRPCKAGLPISSSRMAATTVVVVALASELISFASIWHGLDRAWPGCTCPPRLPTRLSLQPNNVVALGAAKKTMTSGNMIRDQGRHHGKQDRPIIEVLWLHEFLDA